LLSDAFSDTSLLTQKREGVYFRTLYNVCCHRTSENQLEEGKTSEQEEREEEESSKN
jgi:hypothetical protein